MKVRHCPRIGHQIDKSLPPMLIWLKQRLLFACMYIYRRIVALKAEDVIGIEKRKHLSGVSLVVPQAKSTLNFALPVLISTSL